VSIKIGWMARTAPELFGLRRVSVETEEYEATLNWWLGRLQQWRREVKDPPPFDPHVADPFAPTKMDLARKWLPRDPEAERFVIETLALTNWSDSRHERRLGRAGKQLITQLIFASCLMAPGRPARLRDLRTVRQQVRDERPTLLLEIHVQFRATPTMDERAEREAWLRECLQRHLPGLTRAARDKEARRLASKRPVDVTNWILGRRYKIRPATIQAFASSKPATR
jgi:hypothetical protein